MQADDGEEASQPIFGISELRGARQAEGLYPETYQNREYIWLGGGGSNVLFFENSIITLGKVFGWACRFVFVDTRGLYKSVVNWNQHTFCTCRGWDGDRKERNNTEKRGGVRNRRGRSKRRRERGGMKEKRGGGGKRGQHVCGPYSNKPSQNTL